MQYVHARWCVKFGVAPVYKTRDGNLKGKIYTISTILRENKALGQVIKKQYALSVEAPEPRPLRKHLTDKKFANTIAETAASVICCIFSKLSPAL